MQEKKKAGKYSLGMRQRLGIAIALLGDVGLLVLDEPFNGLDTQGIADLEQILTRINKEKRNQHFNQQSYYRRTYKNL